jgi:hypothetical protein
MNEKICETIHKIFSGSPNEVLKYSLEQIEKLKICISNLRENHDFVVFRYEPSGVSMGEDYYTHKCKYFMANGKAVVYFDQKEQLISICYGRKPIEEQLIEAVVRFEELRDALGYNRIQNPKDREIPILENKINYLRKYIDLLSSISKKTSFVIYKQNKNSRADMTFSEIKPFLLHWFFSKEKNLEEIISSLEEAIKEAELAFERKELIKRIQGKIHLGDFTLGSLKELSLEINSDVDNGRLIILYKNYYCQLHYSASFEKNSERSFSLEVRNEECKKLLTEIKSHLIQVASEDPDVKQTCRDYLSLGKYRYWIEFLSNNLEIGSREIDKEIYAKKVSFWRTESVYQLICEAKKLGMSPTLTRKILRRFRQGRKVLALVVELLQNGLTLTEEGISSLMQAQREIDSHHNITSGLLLDAMVGPKEIYSASYNVADVFLEKKTESDFYDTSSEESLNVLHNNYGGRKTYASRSGSITEGYIPAKAMDELIKFKAIRKHPLSTENKLNQWGEDGSFVSFLRNDSLLFVFYKDQTLYFADGKKESYPTLLKGEIPTGGYHLWKYPYLNGCLEIRWWSYMGGDIKEMNLPYNFKVFVKIFMSDYISSLKGYSLEQSHNNLYRPLNVSSSGVIYGELFHLPIKKINLEERFQEGKFFEWPHDGWISTKDFRFRRESSGMVYWFYYGNPHEMLEEFPDSNIEEYGCIYEPVKNKNEDLLTAVKSKAFETCLKRFNVKIETPVIQEPVYIDEEKKEVEISEKSKWGDRISSFIKRIFG